MAGSGEGVALEIDGAPVTFEGHPTTTLLRHLRATGRVGTKEGCAEGDCGACTVAVQDPDGRWRAVNSCLVPVPTLAGRRVLTAEGLRRSPPHPVQAAVVEALGSQCGYCTPGFVMSLFEAAHRTDLDAEWKRDDQLCGNLCRCTGYRPLRDALRAVAGTCPDDGTAAAPTPFAPVSCRGEGGELRAPTDLGEALAWLAANPDAVVIAGGTDLGLQITQRHVRFPKLLSVERIAGLRGVTVGADGAVTIGAATPLTDVEDATAVPLPLLHRMLRFFGARQIKHRGTLGGNLVNASPIGDTPPVCLATDAELELASVRGRRRVAAADFFLAYRRVDRAPDELLVAVHFPPPPPGTRLGAYKVSRRRELDISVVAGAFAVTVGPDGRVARARLAFGGVAAVPIRARAIEDALVGGPWDADAVERAAAALRDVFTPLTDLRATAEYRHRLAANLLRGFHEETRDVPFRALPDRPTGTVLA